MTNDILFEYFTNFDYILFLIYLWEEKKYISDDIKCFMKEG